MAFRRKADVILAYKPDILVVQECEHPDKLTFKSTTQIPDDVLWFGANKNKGLGIFAYNGYKLTLIKNYKRAFKLVIPILVTGPMYSFTLYAIWANNPDEPDGQYVEQVWKAIHHYKKQLKDTQTLLAGDFNSNTIWDRKRREGNHSNVVKFLEEKGIYSCYHLHHKQQQGKEEHPTLYLYRHKDKPYHIDYCFVSADMLAKLQTVEVGDYDFWVQHSDHVPLIVTFDYA